MTPFMGSNAMTGALIFAFAVYVCIVIFLGFSKWLWLGILVFVVASGFRFPPVEDRATWRKTAVFFVVLLLLQCLFIAFATAFFSL
jgi:hypothetical protein